jgi:hypothetical protein
MTPSQLALLTARANSPWPSAGSPPPGLSVRVISKPNPLSGAPAGAFELHDYGGKYITWTDDPAILIELLTLEAQGYDTVLNLLGGGSYKKRVPTGLLFDLEGLSL